MDDPFDLTSRPFDDLYSDENPFAEMDLNADPFATTKERTKSVLSEEKNPFDEIDLNSDPFAQVAPPTPKPKKDRSLASEFATGLKRGIDATQAMGYGLTALAGDVLDVDALRKFGGEGYARNIQQASNNAASMKFTDITEGDGFLEDAGNFAQWAAGGLGELIPNIATIFAGGGVGGAAARAVLPQIAKGAAKKYIGKAVLKEVEKGALKGLTGKAKREAYQALTDQAYRNLGSTMGAFVAGTGMNTGEIFGNFIDPTTGEIIETADRAPRILGTIGGGLLAGALDTVVPAGIFKQANRTRKQLIQDALNATSKSPIAARAAANILLDGTKEGTTEALQELISEAVGVTVDEAREWQGWDEIKPQLIEAFALGALGGTAMRAPIEVTQAKRLMEAPARTRQAAETLAAQRVKQQLGPEWEVLSEEEKTELVKDRAKSVLEEAAKETPETETVLKRQFLRTKAMTRAQEVEGYAEMTPEEREVLIAEQEARILDEAEAAQEADIEEEAELPTVNPVSEFDATSGLREAGEIDEGFDVFAAIRRSVPPSENQELTTEGRLEESIETTPLISEEQATQGLREIEEPDADFDAFANAIRRAPFIDEVTATQGLREAGEVDTEFDAFAPARTQTPTTDAVQESRPIDLSETEMAGFTKGRVPEGWTRNNDKLTDTKGREFTFSISKDGNIILESQGSRLEIERVFDEIEKFSRSQLGKDYFQILDNAREQAKRDYPRPIANGFYAPDTNSSKRGIRQYELIVKNGVPREAWDSGRFNLDLDAVLPFNRENVLALADALNIPYTKREQTAKISAKIKDISIKNYKGKQSPRPTEQTETSEEVPTQDQEEGEVAQAGQAEVRGSDSQHQRSLDVRMSGRAPLSVLAQTVNQGQDVVNNVVRAARRAGYEVRVRNPNTQNPDESFRNVGGTFDPNQRLINLALSETIDIQSTIATVHEAAHGIYNDAPPAIQEALLRWVQKMQNGDFLPFVDPRATDPRLQPDNPYDLPDPIFQEELLVETLTLEGIDRPIAQGIIADIIRVLKDLYYRAAMKFMDANGGAIEETAKVWANNRVAAAMAGQNPNLSLRSLFTGFKQTQEDINQAVYNPQGVFNYRIVNGAKVLPRVLSTEAGAHAAQMNTRLANLEYQYLFNLTAAQRKGERAQQDELMVVRYRLSELDKEYFDALAAGDEELAAKLVAEAAELAGYNVGPVYHGRRKGGERSFFQFRGDRVFLTSSEEVARTYGPSESYYIKGDLQQYDADGNIFWSVPMDAIYRSARLDGRVGVIIKNVVDTNAPQIGATPKIESDVFIIDPSQIKSADTITRDDNGNIIPLSQRLNVTEDDIRFTERGVVEEKSLATKQREYRGAWADTRVHIAMLNELNQVLAPIFEKYPNKTRKEVLQIIGRTGDPDEQITEAIVKFNAVKAMLEEEAPIGVDLPPPTRDITYSDLDTEGQRSYFKEMALNESVNLPSKIGGKISKLLQDLESANATLEKDEGSYNELISKISDAKELEQMYRSGLVKEIDQLKKDVRKNEKAAFEAGSAYALLLELIDSHSQIPYPKQVDQLLADLPKIDNETTLFLVNQELMTLDVEWDKPAKEVYYDVIEEIKKRTVENKSTTLTMLLSGRPFKRNDVKLRKEEFVSRLRGSAWLSAFVAFTRRNYKLSLALQQSQATAEEKAEKTAEILKIKKAETLETLDAMRAEIKALGKEQTNLNKLIYKLAGMEKKIRKAKRDKPKFEEELGILNESFGRVEKYFSRKAIEIGMGREFELVDKAKVPAVIDPNLTPEQILSSDNVEEISLEGMEKPSEEKATLSEKLARKGREIISYINRIESDPSWSEDDITLAHVRLRDMGEKLAYNAISDDMIRADSSHRNMVRSMADQAGQSGTPAGKRIMQLSRMYDFAMNKLQPFIKTYGAPVGASFTRLKKSTGLGFRPLKNMYDSAWAFLEMEKVLTGEEAFEAMADTLAENPNYQKALSRAGVRKQFIDYMKQSAKSAHFGNRMRADLGLLVEDDSIQVPAWSNKEETVSVFRDSLNRGVFMNTRYIRDEMFTFIKNFKEANPSVFKKEGPNLWNFIGEEDGVVAKEETIEEYRKRVNAAFNTDPHFVQQVVEPWILNDRANNFPHPETEDINLSLSVMRSAWRESGGDVVRTAEILANEYNVDPVDYIPRFMKALKGVLVKTDSMAMAQNKRINENGSLSGMSRYGADARVDDDVPSVMTEYTLFSEDTNQVLAKQLAAEYAFGKNLDTLDKFATLMQTQIRNQAAEYEAALLANTTNDVVDMKGVKKELGKDFERLKAAYIAKEKGQFSSKAVMDGFRNVLGNKENSFDIGVVEELHSMIITGMLQGWKSAIKQLSQTYSTVASMRTISQFNALDPFIDLAKTSWAILDMFPRLFGIETFNLGKYHDRFRDAGIIDLDQQVKISDGFKQPGFNGEMARDNGSRFKQYARGIRSMVSRGTFGSREGVMPGFTPFLFRSVNTIQLLLGTDNILRKMEKVAGILSAYKKANPDVNINKVTGEQLGFKNYLIGPDNAQFLDNFMELMFKHGMTNEMLVKQYDERWAQGLRTLNDDAIIRAKTMAQEVFSVESQLSNRPRISQETTLGRMFFALQGWGVQTSMNGIDTILGRDMMGLFKEDPKKVMQASIAGNKAIMFHLLPAALIFSLFFDWYDEELAGKKSDIRPLLGNEDPKDTILSIMERLSVTGPLGILGDMTNEMSNIGTGKPAISIDDRVIFVSSLIQLQKQLSTIISTEAYKDLDNITYNQNVRPLLQAFGMGSILSNTQVVSNLLGLENAEARTAARINTNNALRAAGRTTGLEVRTFGAGFSRAVPHTPHVTNMILAAMSNQKEQFRESYEKAITAMQAYKNVSRGEAKDRVNRSYAQRHPIKAVFRTTPTQAEYKAALNEMSPGLRQDVIDSIENYNKWGATIGVKPYYGKQTKKTEKRLAPETETLSFEEQLEQALSSRFDI